MNKKTYREQAQEEEDRAQEAYLSEYRRKKAEKNASCLLVRFFSSIRRRLLKDSR